LLQGHGALDKGGMVRVYEALLGVEFRHSPQPTTDGDQDV
jgi:hypothetical protein